MKKFVLSILFFIVSGLLIFRPYNLNNYSSDSSAMQSKKDAQDTLKQITNEAVYLGKVTLMGRTTNTFTSVHAQNLLERMNQSKQYLFISSNNSNILQTSLMDYKMYTTLEKNINLMKNNPDDKDTIINILNTLQQLEQFEYSTPIQT